MKLKLILSMFAAAVMTCSCSNDTGPDAPGVPPVKNVGSGEATATFVGKYYRLPYGAKYEGKTVSLWTDTVWCGERVHNQILLSANGVDVSNLKFEFSPLKCGDAEIAPDAMRLRSVQYVLGDPTPTEDSQPSPRPDAVQVADALVEALPASLDKTATEALWLTVDIPADCRAGVYNGTLNIKSGDKLVTACDIRFMVTQHVLPAPKDWAFALDLWQYPFRTARYAIQSGDKVDFFSAQHLEMLKPFYTLLADAGQKCITTYIKDGAFSPNETMVQWTLRADGNWQFDYTRFDKYVEFMMSLGIDRQISCFSVAGWYNSIGYTDLTDGQMKRMDLPIGSELFSKTWQTFLTDFRQHLTQKGWMDRAVLYMDETKPEDMQTIVNTIRANGSDWKIGISGHNQTRAIEKELYCYSTIIGSYPSLTSIPMPMFYTSCSQKHPNNYLTPENSAAEMTWMAWHAMSRGFKGYQRWGYDYWTKAEPFDTRDGRNTAGDFHMIYRSSNRLDMKPVSSIRFEMLRDGIQDYEKCRIFGYQQLRSLLLPFASATGLNAEANVRYAQSQLKLLSTK